MFNRTQDLDRDSGFLNSTPRRSSSKPPSFARSLQWMKVLRRRISDESTKLSRSQQTQNAIAINKLTMHSCRVTLLDAAVHSAGRPRRLAFRRIGRTRALWSSNIPEIDRPSLRSWSNSS